MKDHQNFTELLNNKLEREGTIILYKWYPFIMYQASIVLIRTLIKTPTHAPLASRLP